MPMSAFLLMLACMCLFAYLVTAIEMTWGNRGISRLENISPMQDQQPPMISVVPARITLANDGIEWRGTHYSLAQLRANKV